MVKGDKIGHGFEFQSRFQLLIFRPCSGVVRLYSQIPGHSLIWDYFYSQNYFQFITINFCVVLCIVCFVSFCVLSVCECVLYYCHRVATQLQLTNISYHSWLNRDQLDVTCFIISVFNAQHVSDVNTSILRSLRLMCCGIRIQALVPQPAYGYHTTTAKPQRNTNTHPTRAIQPMK